jgi:hypothetical protein
MAVYVYALSAAKVGTPTGTNTMPASGDMTALPDTVRGSVTIEESEGASVDFNTDQQISPVMTVKTEEGKLTATMRFYDMDFAKLAAIKGGTGNASGYTPATGLTNVLRALELDLVSGHKFEFYNAQLITRVVGSGSRDSMFAVELKATSLMASDNAGSWKLSPL